MRLQPRRTHIRRKQDSRQPAISGKHQGSRQSRGSTKAISGKRRSEQSRVEGPSGCRSRIGARRAKGSGEKGIRRARGVRRAKVPGSIKRMEVALFSFIRSLILHLDISHSHLHLHGLYFSRTHPPTPSHCHIR